MQNKVLQAPHVSGLSKFSTETEEKYSRATDSESRVLNESHK